jgi:uncharacterized membrane protein
MTIATLYITVLRLIHIFAAVAWVGGGIFLNSVLLPTARAAGPDGGRFMLRVASRMARVLTASAVFTVLSGALLFWPTSGGLNPAWLSSAPGIALTFGAIIGIVTMLHGVFAQRPIAAKIAALANDIQNRQGPPPPELMQQAQELGAKLASGALVSLAMGALALFFMAAAQTL